jgi:hypothetical protein
VSFSDAYYLRPRSPTYFKLEGMYGPTNNRVIEVGKDISNWIREQPGDWWTPRRDLGGLYHDSYIIADELYTLLLLRWAV